jgi:steroid 5-alpha reductase family enzyme
MDWYEFFRVAAMSSGLVLGLMTVVWLVSLALRDASIADIFWGSGFVAVAWFAAAMSNGALGRRALVLTLVTLWGARLTGFLLRRNWGREDPRYVEMRKSVESRGGSFALHSLKSVFLAQGIFLWLISLVLVFAICLDEPLALGWPAMAGAGLWVVGMFFEVVGDQQLARFKSDPANKGKIMDRGLWAYTRHPNYFGESCVWFGFWLIACDHPVGIVMVLSPGLLLYALLNITGKALTERRMRESRPDFEDYVRRTSGFFPLPPRNS